MYQENCFNKLSTTTIQQCAFNINTIELHTITSTLAVSHIKKKHTKYIEIILLYDFFFKKPTLYDKYKYKFNILIH